MGAGSSATKSAVDGIKSASKDELVAAVKELSPEEKKKVADAIMAAEAKEMSGIVPGRSAIFLGLKVKDGEDTEFVDKFLVDHMPWMKKTHAGPEEPASMMYAVTKMGEPKDPNDPSAGTTGFSCYSFHECYSGKAGFDAHMGTAAKDKEAGGDILDRFMQCVGKYAVFKTMNAPVIQTLKDPLKDCLKNMNTECKEMAMGFKVPKAEEEKADTFFKDHKEFMDKTNYLSGDVEPVIVFYMVTKMVDPENADCILYSLSEIFKGQGGVDGHMKAGMEDPIGPRFFEMVEKYATHKSMGAGVVACFAAEAKSKKGDENESWPDGGATGAMAD